MTRVPVSRCLDCGERLDHAMDTDGDDKPMPGDATICIHCGHIMAFADDLTLRQLTNDEMQQVAGDARVITARRVVAKVNMK